MFNESTFKSNTKNYKIATKIESLLRINIDNIKG